MNINNIVPLKNLALLAAAFCTATFAFNHNASAIPHALPPSISLTIGDAHELGFVNFGIPSGDSDRQTYVNHLIGMTPGTSDTADGQTYFRSGNSFGPLAPAVLSGHVNGGPTDTSINLGTGGTYLYLFAKYDGPNYGSEVWYVGDLSGMITIPGSAGGYGLSGWTLFGPGGTPGVPDGGTTVMLLGAALGALGMARRYLKS
jgi:VPDSG-CTERM exosortase interaction domain